MEYHMYPKNRNIYFVIFLQNNELDIFQLSPSSEYRNKPKEARDF